MSEHGVHSSGGGRSRGGRGGRGRRRGRRAASTSAGSTSVATTVSTGVTSINLEDLNIGLGALGGGDDTERGTVSLGSVLGGHLIDLVLSGVDGARQTVTVGALVTDDSHSPVGQHVSEGGSLLQVDGVPGNLDKGVAVLVLVGSSNIRRPVTPGVVESTPDTGGGGINSRGVDIEVGGSSGPVVGIGDGQHGRRAGSNLGGNQHGLVTGKHSLAERDLLATLVSSDKRAGTLVTAGLVGEGLLHLSVLVAEHSSVHGGRVGVGGGLGVPLAHKLTGRTGVRAVLSRSTGLVGRHGPSGVLTGSVDRHESLVGREGALATSLLVLVVRVSGVLGGDGSSLVGDLGGVDGLSVAQNAHLFVDGSLVEQEARVACGGSVGDSITGIVVCVVSVRRHGLGRHGGGHQGY